MGCRKTAPAGNTVGAVGLGILLALAISFVIGLALPGDELTPELTARGSSAEYFDRSGGIRQVSKVDPDARFIFYSVSHLLIN